MNGTQILRITQIKAFKEKSAESCISAYKIKNEWYANFKDYADKNLKSNLRNPSNLRTNK
ncbi:MAG: hypothetical protein Fur0022_42950 [Anaerolineales bacterium]